MATAITPAPFLSGFRLIDGNQLNANFALPKGSSQTGITATASGGQTNAYQLTARINNVTTVATAADSVKLPAVPLGKEIWIMNNGASALQVFGYGTDTINGVATATGISQPAGALVAYVGITTTDWRADTAEAASFTSIVLNGSSSGSTTLVATAAAGSTTQTFPAVTGTVASTSGTNLFIADVKRCSTQKDATDTTLANIVGLTAQTLVAGATYRFRCVLPGLADGTGGTKYAFKLTTTTLTSIEATGIGYTASAVAVQHTTTTTDQTTLFTQAAAVIMTILEGSMIVNAGGTIALQQAQTAANGTSSTYVGATMEFVRIA